MSEPQPDRLLTGQEVADLLRVKVCTVRNERKRQRLGFVRVGGQFRHTIDHVKQYIEHQEVIPCEYLSRSSDKLEIIGLQKNLAEKVRLTHGAGPGSTAPLDKRVISASVRQIFKKHPKSLRGGLS